jgi:hypothetical protein
VSARRKRRADVWFDDSDYQYILPTKLPVRRRPPGDEQIEDAELRQFVEAVVAKYDADDRSALRAHAAGGIKLGGATIEQHYDRAEVKAYVRTWIDDLARRIARQRFINRLADDYAIDGPHRDALWQVIDDACWTYQTYAQWVVEADILAVAAMKQLKTFLPRIIELLVESLGDRLIDEVAGTTSPSFGPGVSRDDDQWWPRLNTVETQLDELVNRLYEVNRIVQKEHKPLRRMPTAAVKKAVTTIILPFWKNCLGREVTQAAEYLINMREKKNRADWFAHDVMHHIGGEKPAQLVAEVMKKNTDAAMETAKARELGLSPPKRGRPRRTRRNVA